MYKYISAILFLLFSCTQEDTDVVGPSVGNKDQVLELIRQSLDQKENDPEKSLRLILKGISISEENNYTYGIAKGHSIAAGLYNTLQADSSQIAYHMLKFKEAAESLNSKLDLGSFQYNQGYFLYNENKYDEALVHYFESYDLFISTGKPDKAAWSMYAISIVFYKLHRYEEALAYAEIAASDEADYHIKAQARQHMGLLLYKLERYNEALLSYRKALNLAREQKDEVREAKYLLSLSRALTKVSRFDEARARLYAAKSIIAGLNNKTLEAQSYWKEAFLYEMQEEYEPAYQSYQKALALYEAIGDRSNHLPLYNDMLYASIKAGDYEMGLSIVGKGEEYLEGGNIDSRIMFMENAMELYLKRDELLPYYRYKGEVEQLKRKETEQRTEAASLKVETNYRNKQAAMELEATLSHDRKAMEQLRLRRYTVAAGIVLILCITLMALINFYPLRSYDRRMTETHGMMMKVMENLDLSVKGLMAMFPSGSNTATTEPPDERDLHRRKGGPDKDSTGT